MTDLTLRCQALGIDIFAHQGKRYDLGLADWLRIKRLQVDHWPLSSQASEGFVKSDAGEPGGEACLTAKRGQAAEGVDVGLLHHVLRFAVIGENRAGDTVEPLVVSLHDDTKRLAVAPTRERHQLQVVQRFEVSGSGRIWRLHWYILLDRWRW